MKVKYYTLPDFDDYIEIKGNTLLIYPKPIRNNGLVQLTDKNIVKNWPMTIDDYIEKHGPRLKNIYKIRKIIKYD